MSSWTRCPSLPGARSPGPLWRRASWRWSGAPGRDGGRRRPRGAPPRPCGRGPHSRTRRPPPRGHAPQTRRTRSRRSSPRHARGRCRHRRRCAPCYPKCQSLPFLDWCASGPPRIMIPASSGRASRSRSMVLPRAWEWQLDPTRARHLPHGTAASIRPGEPLPPGLPPLPLRLQAPEAHPAAHGCLPATLPCMLPLWHMRRRMALYAGSGRICRPPCSPGGASRPGCCQCPR